MALASARGRRARLIAAAVPVTIERIASELRAGGTIATAIGGLARSDGVLATDFARIDARLLLGAPMTDALRTWARERPAPGVDVAAGALAMCATVGGRAADALDGVASSLRDRGAVVAEARALSAQARMSALVVGGMPLLYVAWSALADQRRSALMGHHNRTRVRGVGHWARSPGSLVDAADRAPGASCDRGAGSGVGPCARCRWRRVPAGSRCRRAPPTCDEVD